MLLTIKNPNYANQNLIMPLIGLIQTDANFSFECPDDKADELIKISSLPLAKASELKNKKNLGEKLNLKSEVVQPVKKEKKLTPAEKKKEVERLAKEEAEFEKQQLREAIEEGSLEELKELAQLVPNTNILQFGDDDEKLREYLLEKVK